MPGKNYVIQRAVSPWRHHLKQRHGAGGAVRKARCNVYPATPRNQPTPRNHLQTSSKPQDLTIQFSFKMTDLTGFILEDIAGSSSSETSNIVQVVAVTAAWQKDMMETLLRYHQLQAVFQAAVTATTWQTRRKRLQNKYHNKTVSITPPFLLGYLLA
jgi:hypothetical protein